MLNPDNLRRYAITLVLGNVAILGVLLLTMALALQSSRQSYSARAQQAAENLARTLSLGVGAEIRQIDNALLFANQQFSHLSGNGEFSISAGARVANELRGQIPQVDALRFTDAEGTVLNSGIPSAVSVADRDYFKQARERPHQLIISEPIQDRITNRWGIALARARVGADGQFQGVVYANLSTDHFLSVFDDFKLGPKGAVTLRSDTLHLIARFSAANPASSAGVGTNKVSAELTAALAVNPHIGFFVSRTALDGIERASAYERIPDFPLIVLAGLDTEDFFALWRTQALQMTCLATLLELMVGGLSILSYRRQVIQLRSKEESAQLAAEREALLQSGLVGMAKVKERAVVWHNQALCDLFGYTFDELRRQPSRTFYLDDASYEQVGQGYRQLRGGGQYRTQLQMVRKDGSKLWIDLSGAPLPSGESLWMMIDISAVKESEARAQHMAQHDALTGLANRTQLGQSLRYTLRDAQRTGRKLAVCYIDLDGFKAINDQYGHEAGDTLLREVARRMTECVRGNDLVARMGGDEFVILLNDLHDDAQLEVAIKRLLGALAQPVDLGAGVSASVSASIGVALYPELEVDADMLIKCADQAMYAAKRNGKNRHNIYRPGHALERAVPNHD